jgi:Tol biopolymer transport system component
VRISTGAMSRPLLCLSLLFAAASCSDSSTAPYNGPSLTNAIVLVSDRTGQEEIYSMNADGSDIHQLTTTGGFKSFPAVSPDGRFIVFTSGLIEADERTALIRINADGTGLTHLTDSTRLDYQATWSPDGSQIAFSTTRDGNNEIYVMSSSGFKQTNMSRNDQADYDAAWSPSSSTLLFVSSRDGLGGINGEIYSGNARGDSIRPLISGFDPAWSPSGSQFLFKRDGQIYVSDYPNTSTVRQLTSFLSSFYTPSWSADGSSLVFASATNGYMAVWAVSAVDGTGLHQLTDETMRDCYYVTTTRH